MTKYLTCIACKHFYFESGHEGYSDMTPGYESTIKCLKGKWAINFCEDTNESYRLKLLSAEGCDAFDAYEPKAKQ